MFLETKERGDEGRFSDRPFLDLKKKLNVLKGKIETRANIEIKNIIELIVFSFLLTLLIAPGLFYADVMAHEFYHFISHKGVSEEICIDINKPYLGHVKVSFNEESELLGYDEDDLYKEEINADMFGHFVSALYLINALVVVNWMLKMAVRNQRKEK